MVGVWLWSVFLDDHWIGSPSEEAYPCSPRGTGAGRCADLPTSEIPEMEATWLRNMETVEAAIVRDDFPIEVAAAILGHDPDPQPLPHHHRRLVTRRTRRQILISWR